MSRYPIRQTAAPRHRRIGWLWRAMACGLGGACLALAAGWPGSAPDGAGSIANPHVEAWAWALQAGGLALVCAALVAPPRPSAWQVAALAGLAGFVWQAGTVAWLHVALHRYLGLPAGLSVAAVAALCAYLAAYSAAAMGLWSWASAPRPGRRLGAAPPLLAAAAFAGAWLLADLGRTWVFTGFPWASTGHAHVQGPLRSLVPWIGGPLVGALAAGLVAAAVHAVLAGPGRWMRRGLTIGAVAAITSALAAWPTQDFTRPAGEFDALLLQGNVSQDEKFVRAQAGQALGWHLQQMERSFADLTVAPETAIPVLEHELPASEWNRLRARAARQPGVLLVGMPQGRGDGTQYNAYLGIGAAASLLNAGTDGHYRYHKHHLVPFGEFSPPGFAWFTRQLDLPLPSFIAGPVDPEPLVLRSRNGSPQRIAPLICFEDLYGEELALRFRDPARAPTVLVNGSNLGWFDDWPAIAQHLRIARLRSLEFQRPSLRAGNTGATVLIDAQGQVLRALPPRQRGSLAVLVEGRDGLTPYARWASRPGLGLGVPLGLSVLLLAIAAAPAVRTRLPRRG